jgi:hypothetical protein
MKACKLSLALLIIFILPQVVFAGTLEDIYNKLQTPAASSLDDSTIVSGLKEALSLGRQKQLIWSLRKMVICVTRQLKYCCLKKFK